MDMELISEHAQGIIATTGCPSGAIQTRLRLNQYDEAREVAGAYQEIFGKENYFLELMDHGLDLERNVRGGLLRLAKDLDIPLLATNDAHYVLEEHADAHENLLCIGVGKNKDDPNRFRFNGSGYYLKTAAQMRELFSELPEACDNTLLIAERIESYEEVFAHEDEMPQYPDVPEGETQESWLRKDVIKGLEMRYGSPVPEQVMERFETEMKVIGPMGFPEPHGPPLLIQALRQVLTGWPASWSCRRLPWPSAGSTAAARSWPTGARSCPTTPKTRCAPPCAR